MTAAADVPWDQWLLHGSRAEVKRLWALTDGMDARIRAAQALHARDGAGVCGTCPELWPCTTRSLLDDLARQLARRWNDEDA